MLSAAPAIMDRVALILDRCPDCGWPFRDVTGMAPDADWMAEVACGCAGRVRRVDTTTGRVIADEAEPAS